MATDNCKHRWSATAYHFAPLEIDVRCLDCGAFGEVYNFTWEEFLQCPKGNCIPSDNQRQFIWADETRIRIKKEYKCVGDRRGAVDTG